MIKIATVHTDVIAVERIRLGTPRLNTEWLELVNAGSQPVDVHEYFVVNGRGDSFTITVHHRETLIIGAYQSLVIFSGFPDNPADPALCYLANQAMRLFLKRQSYLWNPDEDRAYLYASREACLKSKKNYLDLYHYKRRSAKVFIK